MEGKRDERCTTRVGGEIALLLWADLIGADLVVELEDVKDALADALYGEWGQVSILSAQHGH